MRKIWVVVLLVCVSAGAMGQSVNVERPKDVDYTQFKTFSFGGSEIITPKEERQVGDKTIHTWVRSAITKELTEKGLSQSDSVGDINVTYIIGSLDRSDSENLGPLGGAPGGDPSQVWSRDYQQNSFIIDLQDRQSKLVWRINAIANTNSQESQPMINKVVYEGFRKFSVQPSKKGRKK